MVVLRNVAYEDRLRRLKIPSMRERWLRGDLIEQSKTNIFFAKSYKLKE